MAPRHACSRLAEVSDFTAAECACEVSSEQIGAALDDASDLLYYVSHGTVFGQCSTTVRPCRACFCGFCHRCCSLDTVPLRTPVIEVTEVKINGTVLDPSTYAVNSRGQLYRKAASGNRPPDWPSDQRLWLPDTEPHTFSISHTFGMEAPFPLWVTQAVVELACDMLTFQVNGRSKLPQGTASVVFQGASVIRTRDRANALQAEASRFASLQRFSLIAAAGGGGVYSPDGIDGWVFPTA